MGSSRRKGCRSALFGDREGCRSDGAEGCRSMGSSRRKGVDLRSGDREGCRSAAWSELELFDPRLRRVRKCSIRRFGRTGRVSIRAPGAREGCRSMARIRPEGCRSARPATPKGLDPRDRADRKGVDPRARRPRGVSIHGVDRAGRVSIRASGDSEGSRSAGSNRPDLFDPSPRRPGKCSIRAGVEQGASVRSAGSRGPEGCRSARPAPAKGVDPWHGSGRRGVDPRVRRLRRVSIRAPGDRASVRSVRPASVRSAGSRGPEGCRSARPAPAKGVDPWHGSGRKGVDPCVRRLQKGLDPGDRAPPEVFDPRFRRLRKCSIRGMGQDGSVRSAPPATAQMFDPRAWGRVQVFDSHSARPRKCSIRASGQVFDLQNRAARKGVDPCSGDCEGCRFAARSGPEGCRSARLATMRGLDPRSCVARKCSVIAPGDGISGV